MKKIIYNFFAIYTLFFSYAMADTVSLSTNIGKVSLKPGQDSQHWAITVNDKVVASIPLSKGAEPSIMKIGSKPDATQLAILDSGDSVTIAIDPTKSKQHCATGQPFIAYIAKNKPVNLLNIPTQCDDIYETSLHDGVFEFKIAYHTNTLKFKNGIFFNDSYVIDGDHAIKLPGTLVEKSDKKWYLKLDKAIQVSDGCSFYGVKCLHNINPNELFLLSELPESVIQSKKEHHITASGELLMSSQQEEAVFRLKSITE